MEMELFPFWSIFTQAFVTSSHINQQELFLSVVRSKTMPKKETFEFQLPSMAHECLFLRDGPLEK